MDDWPEAGRNLSCRVHLPHFSGHDDGASHSGKHCNSVVLWRHYKMLWNAVPFMSHLWKASLPSTDQMVKQTIARRLRLG